MLPQPEAGDTSSSARTTSRPSSCSATTSPPTRFDAASPRRRAADALRLCHYKQPDLLLLDLNLPDAPGLDVLREIRATEGATGQLRPGAAGDRAQRPQRPTPTACAGSSAAPTTTSSSRSRSARSSPGCARCCAAATAAAPGPLRVGEIVVDPSRREVRVGRRAGPARQQGVQPPADARLRADPGVHQGRAAARRLGLSLARSPSCTAPAARPCVSSPRQRV